MSATLVRVTINGLEVETPAGRRLVDLLAERGVDPRRVAVERNRTVVPRAGVEDLVVADGDRFEVVAFVGGG